MKRYLVVTLATISIVLLLLFIYVLRMTSSQIDLANMHISDFQSFRLPGASQVFDDEKRVIATTGEILRLPVDSKTLPKNVINAFLAAEDVSFFSHHGVSFTGILRAAFVNLKAGRIVQGASTITQQVAKQLFLTPERSLSRKIREQVIAVLLENKLKKYEILDLYLSIIYFGKGAYGIEAASRVYFGKPASALTLSESAMLAGIPKSPARYAPHINPERSEERRKYVLHLMADAKFITEHELSESIEKRPDLASGWQRVKGPQGILRSISKEIYQLLPEQALSRGVKIQLTYSAPAQKRLDLALEELTKQIPVTEKELFEVAGVTIGTDGSLRALRGSRSEESVFFNYAIQMKRPIGRFSMPLLAQLAFMDGANWSSSLRYWEDAGSKFPSIYSIFKRDDYYSMASLVDKLGISTVESSLSKVGIPTKFRDIRIAAGYDSANLLQIARLGTSWMQGGLVSPKPFLISKVASYEGSTLFERKPAKPKSLFSKESSNLLLAGLIEKSPCKNVVCYLSYMKNDGNFYAMVFSKAEVSVVWVGGKFGKNLDLSASDLTEITHTLANAYEPVHDENFSRARISYFKHGNEKIPYSM